MNNEPFGQPATTRRGRALRWGLALVALAVTVFGVYRVTRASPQAEPAADDSMAGMAGMPGMEPVDSPAQVATLSKAEQQRIGVTFATVQAGNLSHEIRTVAQVTYDETRLTVVSLKVDGWIEALYANSTGQTIRKGDSLFSIYSPILVSAQQELLLAGQLASDVNTGSAAARGGASDLRAAARARLLQWNVSPQEIQAAERDGVAHHALVFTSPVTGIVVEKTIVQGQRSWQATCCTGSPISARSGWMVRCTSRISPTCRSARRSRRTSPALPGQSPTRPDQLYLPHPQHRDAHRPCPGGAAPIATCHSSQGCMPPSASFPPRTGRSPSRGRGAGDGRAEPGVRSRHRREPVARDIVTGKSSADRMEVLRGLDAGETVVASAHLPGRRRVQSRQGPRRDG